MKPAFSDMITISRPVAEVFEFISDLSNGPKMNEDIISIEKLTDGPIGVGSKFKETKIIRGRNAEATIEVVQYIPSEAFSAQSEANGLKVIYHYQMSESTNGTYVHFKCEVKTSGMIMTLTKPLIVKMLKQEDGDHLKSVKRALESSE
ncbi:SRPBCC family protein [Pseudoneobacillus sp. C159]